MKQKEPEFKFKDYHDLIGTFITKKENKPVWEESEKSDNT